MRINKSFFNRLFLIPLTKASAAVGSSPRRHEKDQHKAKSFNKIHRRPPQNLPASSRMIGCYNFLKKTSSIFIFRLPYSHSKNIGIAFLEYNFTLSLKGTDRCLTSPATTGSAVRVEIQGRSVHEPSSDSP